MGQIRIIQVNGGSKMKIFPGNFSTTAEAIASLKETGEYLFLESHTITINKPDDVNQSAQTDNQGSQATEETASQSELPIPSEGSGQ